MYVVTIVALFAVLPAVSVALEWVLRPKRRDLWSLIGRWVVFWAVGVRLFTAGLSQAMQPEYTAEGIFGITDPVVLPFIQELGFANMSIGAVALISVFVRRWSIPAAVSGLLFFGFAGFRHLFSGDLGTSVQLMALISDLYIFAVLAAYLIAHLLRHRNTSVPAAS
ncbi:DUF6790 family protein [Leucobacter sp. HY1910]